MGMISVREVHKSFGRLRAVRGVGFEIEAGQVTGLLGPNGAGKSTTIRMITSYMPPDKGRVEVCGFDTQTDSAEVRKRIGYLPEDAPSYPEMSVEPFLRFRASLYGIRGKNAKMAAQHAMDRCWLNDVRKRRIGHLSKGYRQRVGLASAIVHDPKVVILDEPTNGLDPSQILAVRKLVRELAIEKAVLVSSHILAEVERTCDRVVIIARGKVRADGTPEELLAPLGSEVGYRVGCERQSRDTAETLEKALRAVQGVQEIAVCEEEPDWVRAEVKPAQGTTDLRPAIGAALNGTQLIVRELWREEPRLETLFIRSVRQEDEQ